MTEQEQRIAIAEFCGWTRKQALNAETWAWFNDKGDKVGDSLWHGRDTIHGLLNYTQDLNAMHQAESLLNREQQKFYAHWLWDNVVNKRDCLTTYDWYAHIHTTAAQRAEALLRTIERWVDK